MRSLSTHSFATALFATITLAALVNVTIDDAQGDLSTGSTPQYSPPSEWAQGSKCPLCHVTQHADASQAFGGTWHDSTYHPGQPPSVVQITFNGSAVYVYNMVANALSSTTTFTNLTFVLDGTQVGEYEHVPENAPAPNFLYRTLVYRSDSLTPTSHVLRMEAAGSNASLILFDYVIYTTERDTTEMPPSSMTALITEKATTFSTSTSTPSVSVDGAPSSSSKSSAVAVGSAVGAAVGVFAALATLAIGVFILRRRKSLALRMFSGKTTGVDRPSRPPSLHGVAEDRSAQSSPTPPLSPQVFPPSSMPPSVDTSMSFRSDLVFAPIPTPSPRHSASRFLSSFVTPPAHRADVPAPAISATGTEHSIRLSDLLREIAELEEHMRSLHTDEKGRRAQNSTGGTGHVESETSFTALRERVARLREEMEAERRLLAEALPREKRRSPWPLKGRRLRVVNPEEASNV